MAEDTGPLERRVAREVIRAMPPALVKLAAKRAAGIAFTAKERVYWGRLRGQQDKEPQLRMF